MRGDLKIPSIAVPKEEIGCFFFYRKINLTLNMKLRLKLSLHDRSFSASLARFTSINLTVVTYNRAN